MASKLLVELDKQIFKKLNEFAVPRGINKTHIIRTLIEKSDIKIDVQKYKTIKHNKKDKRREHKIEILMSEELREKMNNMRLHNNITYGEIVNQLVMEADLNSIRFRVRREKEKKNLVNVRLDTTTNRKIREFALVHGFNVSEVIRVLIKKSSMKIKDVRSKEEVVNNSKQKGKVDNITLITLVLSKQLLVKLRKMSLQNKASCSEILRTLIDRADLENLKIKPKIKPERITRILMNLDDFTNNKIKEFSITHNVSLSEIARVLIDNSDLKINARSIGNIIMCSKEKRELNNHKARAWLTEELFDKIKEAALHYDTSYSEILRILIREADLDSMTFRAKKRMKYGRRYMWNRY